MEEEAPLKWQERASVAAILWPGVSGDYWVCEDGNDTFVGKGMHVASGSDLCFSSHLESAFLKPHYHGVQVP